MLISMKSFLIFVFTGFFSTSFAQQLEGCASTKNIPINHFEKMSAKNPNGKRILVFGLIHGDEIPSEELATRWIKRLEGLEPSNHWRIIPSLNPDGKELKTRGNANNVDINRNFPTKDWDAHALTHWKTTLKENKRRYPGPSAGSEIETQCALKHIEEFKPDVIVAIHTPYGLLDFDGPSEKVVKKVVPFKSLPWRRLGTFTGSLGRYMWDERNVPVLTIELREKSLQTNLKEFLWLQDQVSYLAN